MFKLCITSDLGFEYWAFIPGWENYYKVSTYGRVKSLGRIVPREGKGTLTIKEKILAEKNNGVYPMVGIQKNNKSKYYTIHRLVATTFLPSPKAEETQINHKDQNPLNNRVENLEWCTPKYNNNYGTHTQRMINTKNKNNSLGAEQPVDMFTLGGKFEARYKSFKEAARQNNMPSSGPISLCCNLKVRYSNGHQWRRAEGEPHNIEPIREHRFQNR